MKQLSSGHNKNKEDYMTQKELLYVEDAIGHEISLEKILEDSISNMEDESLKEFFEQEKEIHQKRKELLLELLEVKCNE